MIEKDGSGTGREIYRILRLAGEPVMAFSHGPRKLRLASAARIQGFTPKRALFKAVLRSAIAANLDRLISEPVVSPLSPASEFDFDLWLHQAIDDLGTEVSAVAVIWPWPPGSGRGRLYVHMLDDAGRPIAFAKISLDAANDEALCNEAEMLREFERVHLQHARVPQLLSTGSSQGRNYLIVEALPAKIRPVKVSRKTYPAEAVTELSGETETIGLSGLSELPWYNGVLESTEDMPQFMDELITSLADHGASLCRTHGDFEPKNLMRDECHLWVLDWEHGVMAGPRLADPLRYSLLVNRRECRYRPANMLSRILDRKGVESSLQHRLDVGMALAFLHSVNSLQATQLLRHWRPAMEGR